MTTELRAKFKKYDLPKNPPNVAITPDDERILLEVYRHDIIDSKTIYTLLAPRSENKIRNRLKLLHHTKYLHRLSQIEEIHVPGGGSLPAAYTLGVKGANRLKEAYGLKLKMQPRRYRERSKVLGAQHILHTLEQTRFLVSIRKATEHRSDVEFLYPEQIYERFAPELLLKDKLPHVVSARVNWEGYTQEEGTIPDGFFMLFYPYEPEGKNRRTIFLEIDRGTETIDPSDRKIKTLKFWKDTSVLRKFVVYAYAFKTQMHKKVFGVPTFQVLVVTTNPGHVAKMQQMYRRRLAGRPHSVKPYRFLFTDFETISKQDGDVLSTPIYDGEGKPRSLLP